MYVIWGVALRDETLVDGNMFVEHAMDVELPLGALTASAAHLLAEFRVVDERTEAVGQSRRIAHRHQETVHAIVDGIFAAIPLCGDDGPSDGSRLDERQWQSLTVETGECHDV